MTTTDVLPHKKTNLLDRLKPAFSGLKLQLNRDKATYTRMLQYLKPYRQRFFVGLLASIPASALEGAAAFFSGPFVDRLVKTQDYTVLMVVPPVIVAVCVLQGVFEYISQYCATYVGNRISMDIQTHLYNHLLRMDLSYYKQSSYGEITTRYYSDAQKLQQAIVTNLQGLLIQFFTMLFLAAVLFYRNWQLSFIAIGIISLIVIPIVYISRRIRELDYLNREASEKVGNLFNETIYGVRETKSFGLYDFLLQRFTQVRRMVFDTSLGTAKKNIILNPIMQVIASFGVSAIIYIGAIYIHQGKMTPGDLTSFLIALVLLYKPVKVIGSTLGKIQVILAPAERVFQIMDLKPTMMPTVDPVSVGAFEALEFRDVSFAYGEKEVLQNINLTIRAGETIGLVGASGGGKSTLADMISRFIDPVSGAIVMNGVDLRRMDLLDVRARVGVVSQETVLFSGSIRDNILPGRLHATEAQLQEALRVAHLTEWVNTLPDGIDSPVGDRAGFLSGGQKQRIAIARAYLKDTPILVLDEATSALDNESEALVQQALIELVKGRTVIMVAHRLSTIRHTDRILVMEQGRIIETGTHEELLALEGIYHKLYLLQFRESERHLLENPKIS